MVRFVIPAFNEAQNIPRLMADLVPWARRWAHACAQGDLTRCASI
jgi:hypothetical protein